LYRGRIRKISVKNEARSSGIHISRIVLLFYRESGLFQNLKFRNGRNFLTNEARIDPRRLSDYTTILILDWISGFVTLRFYSLEFRFVKLRKREAC
jgi:hypothetical protein